jgi:hypothetical protein
MRSLDRWADDPPKVKTCGASAAGDERGRTLVIPRRADHCQSTRNGRLGTLGAAAGAIFGIRAGNAGPVASMGILRVLHLVFTLKPQIQAVKPKVDITL